MMNAMGVVALRDHRAEHERDGDATDPRCGQQRPAFRPRRVDADGERRNEPSDEKRPEDGEIPRDPGADVVTFTPEHHEHRQTQRVDGGGEKTLTLHGERT